MLCGEHAAALELELVSFPGLGARGPFQVPVPVSVANMPLYHRIHHFFYWFPVCKGETESQPTHLLDLLFATPDDLCVCGHPQSPLSCLTRHTRRRSTR